MHRTGVHRSCRCGDIIRLPGQVPGRIRHEALQTTCSTEMMGYPLMLGVLRGPDRPALHATYRIPHGYSVAGVRVTAVIVGARVVMDARKSVMTGKRVSGSVGRGSTEYK